MSIQDKRTNFTDTLRDCAEVSVYVDFANVLGWQNGLGWGFKLRDLVEILSKLPNVKEVKFYHYIEDKDAKSWVLHKRLRKYGAIVRSKPPKYVKKEVSEELFMRHSTRNLLNQHISTELEQLVAKLHKLDIKYIVEKKANFDVEIALDMIADAQKVSAMVLLSGDGDFVDVAKRVRVMGKKFFAVGVRGRTAKELIENSTAFIDFGTLYNGERHYDIERNRDAL